MIQQFLVHPLAVLFLILALGLALGNLRLANLTLGSSGVLFVALIFGHLGFRLPEDIQELGIILFVYAVGLQAGPRFFNQFKARGLLFAEIGITVVAAGALITLLVTWLFHLDPALAVGMYAGAMTSTPALASAMDAARNPTVSVGYGIAYPFGVIGVVIFVQLLPRLIKIDLEREEEIVRQSQPAGKRVERRQFVISNPACGGKSLLELKLHSFAEVNISRIRRGSHVEPARPETKLQPGDIVLAVGKEEELEKLKVLFGEETQGEEILNTSDVIARDVFVSSHRMIGKSLGELGILEHYGVVITRVFREDMEFVPTGNFVLEIGDSIRATGSKEAIEHFVADAGQNEKRIHETNILALSLGIFAGVILGFKSFSLPGGASFRLGLAGGPLLVSLILAHFGRIGRINIRIPRGAKYIMSQLGLVLFLAGAGTAAGSSMVQIISRWGISLLLAGALITLGSSLVGFILSRYLFRLDMLTVLGAISGGMTSTPALGAVTEITESRQPLLSYTAVYPVALIVITVICQFLYFLLQQPA